MTTIAQRLPGLQQRSSASQSSASNNDAPAPQTLVDKIVDNTYLTANYTGSGLAGGVGGVGAYFKSAPLGALKTAGSAYKNLWKTEMIGPNLKTIAMVAAAPVVLAGAALAVPFAVGAGIWHGASEVDSSQPRQFTIGEAGGSGFSKTAGQLDKAFGSCVESLEELGNQKLGEGEKPLDIPLLKTLKSTAVGIAGVVVGGVAGLVSAAVSTVSEAGRGIYHSFADENLGLGGKLLGAGTAVLGSVPHGVVYGVGTALSTVGRGIGQTWEQDSLFSGLGKVFSEAGVSVAAGLLPETMLLQEKQS